MGIAVQLKQHVKKFYMYNVKRALELGQIVHGMEEGHASNHGETFTKTEVLSSMKGMLLFI